MGRFMFSALRVLDSYVATLSDMLHSGSELTDGCPGYEVESS